MLAPRLLAADGAIAPANGYRPDLSHKVELPRDFIGTPPAGDTAPLIDRIGERQREYLEALDSAGSFSGVYLRGDKETRLDDDDTRHGYALEWELFENGRRESRIRLERKKAESELQYYQLLRDMHERLLAERVRIVQRLANRARRFIADHKFARLDELADRYQTRLARGFATREEYVEVVSKRERAYALKQHFDAAPVAVMSVRDWRLINRIEELDLAESRRLDEQAEANSVELRIQDLFIARSEYFPSWKDNLSLRVYVGSREDFARSDSDRVVGVRLRVPIDFDRHRDEIIRSEQTIYQDQKAAIVLRIRQKVARLADLFKYHQTRVRLRQQEYALAVEQQLLQTRRITSPLPMLDAVPDKTREQLALVALDRQEQALLARLDAYETLVRLAALLHAPRVDDLLRHAG